MTGADSAEGARTEGECEQATHAPSFVLKGTKTWEEADGGNESQSPFLFILLMGEGTAGINGC